VLGIAASEAERTERGPNWARVGSTLLSRPTVRARAVVVEEGAATVSLLRGMHRFGEAARQPIGSMAQHAVALFPVLQESAFTSIRGRLAVFPSTMHVRAIDRVGRQGGSLAQRLDRLARRSDTMLDALTDLGDALAWTDADVIRVHNTFHLAALTTPSAITAGLSRSMPLPLLLDWKGVGAVKRDPCQCRKCRVR
jgi:hypothetical protein